MYERKGVVSKIEMEMINYDVDEILEKTKDKKYKDSEVKVTRVTSARFPEKTKEFEIFK